jgi:hypothetical protein
MIRSQPEKILYQFLSGRQGCVLSIGRENVTHSVAYTICTDPRSKMKEKPSGEGGFLRYGDNRFSENTD